MGPCKLILHGNSGELYAMKVARTVRRKGNRCQTIYLIVHGAAIRSHSYMTPESDLEEGQFRLLEVDNNLVLPVDTHVRFIVTGADVIHNFAVPALGIKLDAIPGRLNQTSVLIQREGTYYGQCSELCLRLDRFIDSKKARVCLAHRWFYLTAVALFIFKVGEYNYLISEKANSLMCFSKRRMLRSRFCFFTFLIIIYSGDTKIP